jgi:hypothetical protein
MSGHAGVTAAAGGFNGSRWSCLTVESQAGLSAHPYAGRERPRAASTAPR